MKKYAYTAFIWICGFTGFAAMEGTKGSSSTLVLTAVLAYWLPIIAKNLDAKNDSNK